MVGHEGKSAFCRYEYAGPLGSRDDPQDNPFRDTRHRVSPMILYRPTEFSRLRLQYNYDHAMSLAGHDASTVWLGVEVLFGAHAAHVY